MNTKTNENNARLRELVEASGVTQAVALTIFNRGLGPAAYSESSWKAFFSNPDGARWRWFSDDLLEHAEKVFARHAKNA